jgi:hypothetical protein
MIPAAPADDPLSSLPPKAKKIIDQALADAAVSDRINEWNADDPDLLLNCQPATKVYANNYGQIVILQEGRGDDEDPFVRFDRAHVPKLIARLQQFLRDERS